MLSESEGEVHSTRIQALVILAREGGALFALPVGGIPEAILQAGNVTGDGEVGANTVLGPLPHQGIRGQALRTESEVLVVDIEGGGQFEESLRAYLPSGLDPPWGASTDFAFAVGNRGTSRWPHGPSLVGATVEWLRAAAEEAHLVSLAEAYETDVSAWVCGQEGE